MSSVKFTIATLVTDHVEYGLMRETFAAKGFGDDCEFLILDNSETNVYDGFTGYNWALNQARGEFVILCHQDVRLDFDDRHTLEERLAELEALDPTWAVVGNAGGLESGSNVVRITDLNEGLDCRIGVFPARVCSLDENFLLVKAETRVSFSRDLYGFHFYGSDLCLQAEMRGYSAYAIDFHLRHLSTGNFGTDYFECQARFLAKWEHAFRKRYFRTTKGFIFLEGAADTAELHLETHLDFLALSLFKYYKGDWHGTIEAARSAVQIAPDLGPAWNNLCAAYNRLEMHEEAKAAGTEAVRLEPHNQVFRANLSWALYALGDEEAPTLGGVNAQALEFCQLSLFRYNKEDWHGTIEAARSAVELAPDLGPAWNNLCAAYNRLEMYEEARKAGKEAVRLEPDNQVFRTNLWWTLHTLGSEETSTLAGVEESLG